MKIVNGNEMRKWENKNKNSWFFTVPVFHLQSKIEIFIIGTASVIVVLALIKTSRIYPDLMNTLKSHENSKSKNRTQYVVNHITAYVHSDVIWRRFKLLSFVKESIFETTSALASKLSSFTFRLYTTLLLWRIGYFIPQEIQ